MVDSKPGVASASAGSSGSNWLRFADVPPMPPSVPPYICGIATTKSPRVRTNIPAITSVMARGAPAAPALQA
jgi:hypothetical protein